MIVCLARSKMWMWTNWQKCEYFAFLEYSNPTYINKDINATFRHLNAQLRHCKVQRSLTAAASVIHQRQYMFQATGGDREFAVT